MIEAETVPRSFGGPCVVTAIVPTWVARYVVPGLTEPVYVSSQPGSLKSADTESSWFSFRVVICPAAIVTVGLTFVIVTVVLASSE